MRTLSADTSPEAERVWIAALRAMPVGRKIEMMAGMNALLATLAGGALARTHAGISGDETRDRLDEARLGSDLARQLRLARARRGAVRRGGTTMASDPVSVIMVVIGALDRLGIPYYIGGSFASGAHGAYRATADADIVAGLGDDHVEPFAAMLADGFYADATAMHDAIDHRSSFNLLHLETGFKVDIFVAKGRAFDRSQFERRVRLPLSTRDDADRAYVASGEDIVLANLEWYRLVHEVSERQWNDVLGVLKVRATALDLGYLRHWAARLGLTDLLDRALDDAGLV